MFFNALHSMSRFFVFFIISLGVGKLSCPRNYSKITACWDKTCAGEKATTPCPMMFFRTNGKFDHTHSFHRYEYAVIFVTEAACSEFYYVTYCHFFIFY